MKYEMTKKDQDLIEFDMRNNRTLKHLKNMSFYKFTIGDVLIREDKYEKTEWKTRMADCGLPYKYVYVFENELGVGYIRRLSVNGRKFVDTPVCVMEFDPMQTRFSLDPEYADHILLSPDTSNFDIKSRYDDIKKRREQVHRKNKKIRVSIANEAEAVLFIQKLKVGDQFWFGYHLGNIGKDPYYVTEVHLGPQDYDKWFCYTTSKSAYPQKIYYNRLLACDIFLTRPTFLDDTI